MPMDAQILKQSILDKTTQHLSGLDLSDPNIGDQVADLNALALAEAIIEHIQAAAQVLPGIAVATTGSQSAQTGTTTAPGEIL